MAEIPTENTGTIGFVDIVTALRQEINAAVEKAKKDNLGIKFTVQDIEVELQTVATQEGNATASIKVLAFKAGGGVKVAESETQKIKFKLQVKPSVNNDESDESGNKGAVFVGGKST